MEYALTTFHLVTDLTDSLGCLCNDDTKMVLSQDWGIFTTDLYRVPTSSNGRTTLIRLTKMFL